jgi:hypothetical protein
MAKGPGSLSKGFFVKTKGLFLKTKDLFLKTKDLFAKPRGFFPKTKVLSLESTPLRLESKRLFVESERLSRDRTVHSKRNTDRSEVKLVASVSLSAQGAISSDGGRRFFRTTACANCVERGLAIERHTVWATSESLHRLVRARPGLSSPFLWPRETEKRLSRQICGRVACEGRDLGVLVA